MWSIGALVGGAVEFSTNYQNACVASVADTIESSYLIYYYINNYLITNEEDDMAYAFTYMMKLVTVLTTFACPFVGTLPEEFRSGAQSNKSEFMLKQNTDIYDVFDTLYNVLGDVEEIIGLLEVVIDVQTVYDEFIDCDYFESGLYGGKGVVNAFYTAYAIIQIYFVWELIIY